jgi:hypothetical protein
MLQYCTSPVGVLSASKPILPVRPFANNRDVSRPTPELLQSIALALKPALGSLGPVREYREYLDGGGHD